MTEYKLVVVGGKLDHFFFFLYLLLNYFMEIFICLVSFFSSPNNSWRRGQKCIDNSTHSKSVSVQRRLLLLIILFTRIFSFIDEYDPTIGMKSIDYFIWCLLLV
jgi:hypothetical protein